jgi:hypothetical protein
MMLSAPSLIAHMSPLKQDMPIHPHHSSGCFARGFGTRDFRSPQHKTREKSAYGFRPHDTGPQYTVDNEENFSTQHFEL